MSEQPVGDSKWGGDPDSEMQAYESVLDKVKKNYDKREKLPSDVPPYSMAAIWWRHRGDRKKVMKHIMHNRNISRKEASKKLKASLEKYPAVLKKYPGGGKTALSRMKPDPWDKKREKKVKPNQLSASQKFYPLRHRFLRVRWLLAASAVGFVPYPGEKPDKNGMYWRTVGGKKVPFGKGQNFKDALQKHGVQIEEHVPISEEDLKKPFNPNEPERMHDYFEAQSGEQIRFAHIHKKYKKMINKTPTGEGWSYDEEMQTQWSAFEPEEAAAAYKRMVAANPSLDAPPDYNPDDPNDIRGIIWMCGTTNNTSKDLTRELNDGWDRAKMGGGTPGTGYWEDPKENIPYFDASYGAVFTDKKQAKGWLYTNNQDAIVGIDANGKAFDISVDLKDEKANTYKWKHV